MPEVSSEKTPLGEFEAAKLVLAYAPEFLPGLGREGARLILAHTWGLELGKGKGGRGRNIGNLMAAGFNPDTGKESFTKTNKFWKGDYWRPPWFSDPTHKLHKRMLEGKAPSAFRAYDSYTDSMRDYLALISRTEAGRGALDGRAFEFAKGVWESGYCQDSACQPSVMADTLKKYSLDFAKKGYFDSLPSTVPRGVGILGGLAIIGVAGGIFWATTRKPKKGKKAARG